jgi:hypothetical protein
MVFIECINLSDKRDDTESLQFMCVMSKDLEKVWI